MWIKLFTKVYETISKVTGLPFTWIVKRGAHNQNSWHLSISGAHHSSNGEGFQQIWSEQELQGHFHVNKQNNKLIDHWSKPIPLK